jgi:hypothetical protein
MNTPEHIKSKFLPLKQSKAMSDMGFDEECLAYHENQDGTLVVFYSNLPLSEEQEKRPNLYKSEIRNSALPQWATAAPTVTDALDWFFDRFRLYGEIFMDDDLTFGFLVSRPAFVHNVEGRLDYNPKRGFRTRYEARMACLDEMVSIVKERRHLDEGPKPVTELMRKLNLLDSERPAESFGQNDELRKTMSEEANRKSNEKKK